MRALSLGLPCGSFRHGVKQLLHCRLARLQADGDDGSGSQVVLYGYGSVGEVQVFLHDGKPRPYAADVLLHRLDRRGEPRKLRLVFLKYPRPLVGEANRVSTVQDGHGYLGELGVDEVFRHLPDHRVRDSSSAELRLFVNARCEVFNVIRRRCGVDLGDARRALEIVVQSYARDRVDMCIVVQRRVFIGRFTLVICFFSLVVQFCSVFQIRYSAFFNDFQRHCIRFQL